MSHLSSQQISGCLIGAADPSAHRHLRECAVCRAEIESATCSLALFRDSLHRLSEPQTSRVFETAPVLLLMPESTDRPNPGTAAVSSLLAHCAMVALLVVLGSAKPVRTFVHSAILIAPNLRPHVDAAQDQSGGGGGGDRSGLDASKGKLPKPAPRQFTPPRVDPIDNPKLPMTPTIIAPPDLPSIVANNYGDPLSRLTFPSNGSGYSGGLGSGGLEGVGPGKGQGAGPGSTGGFGGSAYRPGGGVTAPRVLTQVEPEYSEEARHAKWQGTVELSLVVDENGVAQRIRVTKPLGLGLDQKAVEAVMKWRFKPGMKDGKPVPVVATIEVTFRLL